MKVAESAEISVRSVVHDDHWVTAETVDVNLDNGKTIKNFLRITTKSGGYAMVVPRLKDGRFVMTRQYKPVGGLTIEGAAGAKEPGETWEQAAARETIEETGYKPGKLVAVGNSFCPQTDRVNNPCHLFLAFDCEVSPEKLVGDEVQGIERLILTKEDVCRMIQSGQIKDLSTLAGILAHFLHAGEANAFREII